METLVFDTDDGAAAKAALGLIVLAADETMERELGPLFQTDGVTLFHSRIPSAPEVTRETLSQMEADLPQTARLLPSHTPLSVVGFGCTSGATVIGADRIGGIVKAIHPEARTTDPITAVIAACRHLGVKRLGMVTPYVAEVSAAMRDLLADEGFEIAALGTFAQAEEAMVARITPDSVQAAVIKIGADPHVDAVFASCTNLRTFAVIEPCEQAVGKPVITSNQALAWHMMTLAGLPTEYAGPGRLFGRD